MESYTNNDMFKPLCEKPSNYIKVIGVGGGGGNAVNHMLEEGIQGVDFVLCNTDYQALTRSQVPTKIHLGKRELGAGNDPNVGREAALSSEDEISKVLDDHTKMLFVTAGELLTRERDESAGVGVAFCAGFSVMMALDVALA